MKKLAILKVRLTGLECMMSIYINIKERQSYNILCNRLI